MSFFFTNQELVSFIRSLGYKNVNDGMLKWLRGQLNTTEGSLNDLWFRYLRQLGYQGSLNDMFRNYSEDTKHSIPSLYIDFANGTGNNLITFTRTTTATRMNSLGELEEVPVGTMRAFSYAEHHPSTLESLGYKAEPSATNRIKDNTGTAAVVGAPGTLPTDWSWTNTGTLSTEVVSKGTQNGINYVDVRLFGTTSTTSTDLNLAVSNNIAATIGQVWAGSAYLAIVGGAFTNITGVALRAGEYSITPTYLDEVWTPTVYNSLPTSVSPADRKREIGTTNQATIAYILPYLQFTFASGVAIDITLRIGLPQLENNIVTSAIYTTGTVSTRNGDSAVINSLTPWYNQNEGTFVIDAISHYLVGTSDSTSRIFFAVGDPTKALGSAEMMYLVRQLSTSTLTFAMLDGGAAQLTGISASIGASTRFRAAFSYKLNDCAGSFIGAAALTDTAATIPTPTKLSIGNGEAAWSGISTSNGVCGTIKSLSYYNTRKSNADLVILSSL